MGSKQLNKSFPEPEQAAAPSTWPRTGLHKTASSRFSSSSQETLTTLPIGTAFFIVFLKWMKLRGAFTMEISVGGPPLGIDGR
ncbi:hypothetical protein B7463_g7865, partial [Scytalidium lignicola]